jgi:hypothetical protein
LIWRGDIRGGPFKAASRGVQRRLSEFGGFERGKCKGNLVPSEANVAKKHHYLRSFFANRAKPPGERLREVYTDESYIHEHYHRNEDSLHDPEDNEDVIYQKEKHKGRRYCFCATAYHCVYGADVPKWHNLKKQECFDYLMAQLVQFDPAMSAMELKQLLKQYIFSNVKIEVEHLAEAGGHTVLFTPAYHSDLQPIELVWALVKGNAGHQHSNQMTLKIVYDQLMHEFNQLENSGHQSINGMIEKCAALALQ